MCWRLVEQPQNKSGPRAVDWIPAKLAWPWSSLQACWEYGVKWYEQFTNVGEELVWPWNWQLVVKDRGGTAQTALAL